MRKEEFQILYAIYKQKNQIDMDRVMEQTGLNRTLAEENLDGMRAKGWVTDRITEIGFEALNEYKVNNAVIMAAGFGLRSLPLSRIVPKGLFVVKGEVLIERQIRQLLEAGIQEIIVVVGFLKEQFQYLKEKYGVTIVENEDYYRFNNISTLYAAKDYLKNSFVCCSDNYFQSNVFEEYVYDSYYSCKYADEYADEHCVTKTEGEYITEIHKGGSNAWYTIGEAYFSKSFSATFLKYLEQEYQYPETKKMLWDDFHIRHIDELPLVLVKYSDDMVQEFDTIEDVINFDPKFREYKDRLLDDYSKTQKSLPEIFKKYGYIERYNSAVTDQHTGRLHLNENTFGPSPACLEVLKAVKIQDLYEYDMASKDFLIEEIAATFSIPADDIYIHNGSAEVIKSVFSIALERGDCILTSNPGWSYYESLAKEKFCDVFYYNVVQDDYTYYADVEDLLKKAKKYRPKLIVLTSPHNPTGCKLDGKAVERIVRENTESLVLLDEAYWGFSEENIDSRRLVETYSNIIISRTFSKFFGLADIRIGYGFCNAKVKHIYGLDLPLFRESSISRKMAVAAMHDRLYYDQMNQKLNEIKTWFTDELNKLPAIHAFLSCSNFVAVKAEGVDLRQMQSVLKEEGILIRLFQDKEEMLARISISDQETMNRATDSIRRFILKE